MGGNIFKKRENKMSLLLKFMQAEEILIISLLETTDPLNVNKIGGFTK